MCQKLAIKNKQWKIQYNKNQKFQRPKIDKYLQKTKLKMFQKEKIEEKKNFILNFYLLTLFNFNYFNFKLLIVLELELFTELGGGDRLLGGAGTIFLHPDFASIFLIFFSSIFKTILVSSKFFILKSPLLYAFPSAL